MKADEFLGSDEESKRWETQQIAGHQAFAENVRQFNCNLRLQALQLATQLNISASNARGDEKRVLRIASDLYDFVFDGTRPDPGSGIVTELRR